MSEKDPITKEQWLNGETPDTIANERLIKRLSQGIVVVALILLAVWLFG